ncbi:MAG: hypothetical protein KGM87_13060 [Betaproteobacteria bacterium]|nr:hypothetical protein [Betaproteobacteria bacterium]
MPPEFFSPPPGRPALPIRSRAGRTRLGHALRVAVLACAGMLGPATPSAQAAPAGASGSGYAMLQVVPLGAGDTLAFTAVPGKDNPLGFAVQCHTMPPGRVCDGGTLAGRFPARETQSLVQVTTEGIAPCVNSPYYFSCPIAPLPDQGMQRVSYTLRVAPGEYATNVATVEGRDGLHLATGTLVTTMKGEGTLSLAPTPDVIIPDDSRNAIATLHYSNAGPSNNRGLRLRIGPFPDYLQPSVMSDEPDCVFEGNLLECRPPDLPPGVMRDLAITIYADLQRAPPLPVKADIEVEANSELGQAQTVFSVVVMHVQ